MTTLRTYNFGNVTIIRPFVDSNLFSSIETQPTPDKHIATSPTRITVDDHTFIYRNASGVKLFVLKSTFCVLEPTVFGPPVSFEECFKRILTVVNDEYKLAEKRGADDPWSYALSAIKYFKIIGYCDF